MKIIENQEVEFKKIWKDEWLEWICGFANTTGGTIYIGVDDNGQVVGLNNTASDLLDKLPGKIKDTLGIITEIKLEKENNLEYISIKVDKYPIPISYHGKFYLRSGRSNHEATASEYDRLTLERYGKTWDELEIPNVTVDELDETSIKRFKELAVENRRLKENDVNVDNKHLLENLKLYENGNLTTSAILLFHKDPEKWIPSAYTKIGFFGKNEADLKYQDEVHGSLIYQAEKIVEMLYSKYFKAMVYFRGMQRIDEYIIPEEATREIVYNILQHRIYNCSIPTQIRVFDDYVYFWNYGEMPEIVKDRVYEIHPSVPRNLKISQTFFRAGFVEYWGSGMKKIKDTCEKYGVPVPEIINEAGGVAVKCKPSKNYLKALNGDKKIIEINNANNTQIDELTERQKEIVRLIQIDNTITQAEMAKKLNITRQTITVEIKYLRDMKVIERVGSTKKGYWKIL